MTIQKRPERFLEDISIRSRNNIYSPWHSMFTLGEDVFLNISLSPECHISVIADLPQERLDCSSGTRPRDLMDGVSGHQPFDTGRSISGIRECGRLWIAQSPATMEVIFERLILSTPSDERRLSVDSQGGPVSFPIVHWNSAFCS